ncbi:MAG: hypothetical protein WBE68_08745 [Candidatus Nitrosopolaris sp.]|jgi:hypothetical protein
MIKMCEHDFESYGSEMVDKSTMVIWYECTKCGKELEDIEDSEVEGKNKNGR